MNAVLSWSGWLVAAALSTAVQAGTKVPPAIDPAHCQPPGTDLALPAAWAPYRDATRVCALAERPAGKAPARAPAKVRLVAVFTDAYYRNLPADAPWERFPLPLLVDEAGRCLARLPHLFPVDPPEDLEVRPGRWRDGIPQEIQLQVRSSAQGGDYRLPTLRWDGEARFYRAFPEKTAEVSSKQDHTPCP
ncbi:hypothetical protein [Paracidovorax cattleyae]|uniref:hypothetical protein n=1 Tax=Paracidovorax cattleyae TaxID=80868 RepID=UPI0018AFFECA|nr:hypothetical protein [Paracidovorax cattleyae]MBF9265171.1 hypothetical protein [Paracidovorax cattleyae]